MLGQWVGRQRIIGGTEIDYAGDNLPHTTIPPSEPMDW